MPEMITKEGLRQEMIKMRKAMTGQDVMRKSALIVARLMDVREYVNAKSIMFYVPKGNEVNIESAIKEAIGEGITVLIPAAKGQTLIPVAINEYPAGIEKGPLAMGEPKDKTEYTGVIDIAVIPGLAFNLQGRRLGRGGGHYDRMLTGRNIFRIGVAYEFQLREFPAEAHDQPMDVLVTESRTIMRK
ncbi:5-formyltetrahydrofolate cyclo-ligase [Candidatus Woesearchaeota archaeon]|nr:5-formyltetrahydrofolate cyclo-ligase [Candidatus Woesearchaeota archaeon]